MTSARRAVLLALVIGLSPRLILAQSVPPSVNGEKVQPMTITVNGPPGPATAAATEKVRQAALQSGAAMTLEKARAALSNKTNMTFGPDFTAPPIKRYDAAHNLISETPATPTRGVGTQVEYVAPGGKSFLWFPANPLVVLGEWTLEEHTFKLGTREGLAIFNLVNLCFHYAGTGTGPGAVRGVSCSPAYSYLKRLRESVEGDIFGLSRRPSPPFILDRQQTTFDTLRKKAGG